MAACFWLPALRVPFFQDDFAFLTAAEAASGRPWGTLLLSKTSDSFWRPLSVSIYWRIVVQGLSGSAMAAHFVNLLLLACASATVGLLAWKWADIELIKTVIPGRAAGFAAFLFGIHSAQFLPANWICTVQETLALLFTSLALLAWTSLLTDNPAGRQRWVWSMVWTVTVPILFALALLSKEGAITALGFGALLAARVRALRGVPPASGIRALAAAIACLLIAAVWFAVRSRFVLPQAADSPYALKVGPNVLRNTTALLLFGVNLPRETILLFLEQRMVLALVWGAVCAALQCAALWAFWKLPRKWEPIGKTIGLFAGAWVVVGLAPYLLLAWNCYPYYALFALVAYAGLIALAASGGGASLLRPTFLAVASSILFQAGQHIAPYPAPIARAEWGERTRYDLAANAELRRAVSQHQVLVVRVQSLNRFTALGSRGGIAGAVGLPVSAIRVVEGALPGKSEHSDLPTIRIDDTGVHY